MMWGLKGGISINADSGPPRYVLWCCGSICHEVLTFIQFGCGHTVRLDKILTGEVRITKINGSKMNYNEFLCYLSTSPVGILSDQTTLKCLKNYKRIPNWEGIPKSSGFSRFLDQTVSTIQLYPLCCTCLSCCYFWLGITVGWAISMPFASICEIFHWLNFIIFQNFFVSSSLKSVANYGVTWMKL